MTAENRLPVTAENRLQAFQRWLESVEGGTGSSSSSTPAPLHPCDVLLAEHHLMAAVLESMQREAQRLAQNEVMRPDFWSDVVDFIGNFTHMVHRPKEEILVFPLLAQRAPDKAALVSSLSSEHSMARRLTVDLCDGVSEGDWERVLKECLLYVEMIGEHLETEEANVLQPLRDTLTDEDVARLGEAGQDLERKALRNRDVKHYVDVARRVCAANDVDFSLGG